MKKKKKEKQEELKRSGEDIKNKRNEDRKIKKEQCKRENVLVAVDKDI